MSVTLFQDFAPFQGQEFLKVSLFPKFSNYRFSRNLWRFAGRNFQKCHVFRIPCKKLQFDPYRAGCLQPQWVTLFHKNREFHGQEFSKMSRFQSEANAARRHNRKDMQIQSRLHCRPRYHSLGIFILPVSKMFRVKIKNSLLAHSSQEVKRVCVCVCVPLASPRPAGGHTTSQVGTKDGGAEHQGCCNAGSMHKSKGFYS